MDPASYEYRSGVLGLAVTDSATHMRMLLSDEPDMTHQLSGENETDETEFIYII